MGYFWKWLLGYFWKWLLGWDIFARSPKIKWSTSGRPLILIISTSMSGHCKYSCETATQTLEWIKAILDFVKPFTFLINAHVVNFFTDRLWEAVDKDWIDCLRRESIENLLLIPSGVVQVTFSDSYRKWVIFLDDLSHSIMMGISLNCILNRITGQIHSKSLFSLWGLLCFQESKQIYRWYVLLSSLVPLFFDDFCKNNLYNHLVNHSVSITVNPHIYINDDVCVYI